MTVISAVASKLWEQEPPHVIDLTKALHKMQTCITLKLFQNLFVTKSAREVKEFRMLRCSDLSMKQNPNFNVTKVENVLVSPGPEKLSTYPNPNLSLDNRQGAIDLDDVDNLSHAGMNLESSGNFYPSSGIMLNDYFERLAPDATVIQDYSSLGILSTITDDNPLSVSIETSQNLTNNLKIHDEFFTNDFDTISSISDHVSNMNLLSDFVELNFYSG
ncbi:14301_t:CDS:2 [Acaulospora colombiana]|uniref:14301_t:CDS:1 n=1 Tax=Acaulospora colombiana TaxID=27376 RepID=A0ACA9KND6_9GLOM|nr:14301_t:CDS:2 [Acaulospora colombiana]